ncbi:hypothetical protein, partial [Burkholderia ubonensis]|uniref:hypothetical protein n=1 Tax=Burkholderia ubonensis TaxID=101571 RepID=UPI000ADAD676
RPWDVALLRQHIAEAFRQFERGDAMVPPLQVRTDTDAAHTGVRPPHIAHVEGVRFRELP